MPGVHSTDPKPAAKALVVGTAALRGTVVAALRAQQVSSGEADDPYAAMTELCRRPQQYNAVVLSLQSLYREELAIIPSIKRACRHVEVWLADIDGRSAALAEAMRLGADGLLGEDGLHRLGGADGAAEDDIDEPPVTRAESRPSPDPLSSPVVRAVPLQKPPIDEEPVTAASPRRSAERLERLPAVERSAERSREPEPQQARSSPDEPVLSADELRALLSDPGVG